MNRGPDAARVDAATVPMLNEIDVKLRREGVLRGGYIAKKETGKLDPHPAFLRQ